MRNREANFAGQLVRHLGEASCLIDAATGQTISSSGLSEGIRSFAAGFLAAGLVPGDRILLACAVSPASTLSYLGAIYAGIVPVLFDERFFTSTGEAICARAGAKAVWSTQPVPEAWVKNAGIIQLVGNLVSHSVAAPVPHECEPHDLAVLMPTSGSTGLPQLVMMSHENLKANTEAIIRSQRLGTDERAMLIMPISYCFGASVMHTHLWQGGGVVFDSRFMFPDKVLHAIHTHACTTFAGVPMVYNVLLRRSNLKTIAMPSLRRFLQAGGALAPDAVEQMTRIVPTAKFFVMYGQTEATARISCLPPERLKEKLGSAGIPLDNVELRIADQRGKQVSPGQVGEIQVRGPSVCRGYFNDSESTQSKFSNGWLKTGDFACRDTDGYLWIKGRTDEFIKIRGVRISAGEVEAKIGAIAGVYECAAVGVQHPEAGEALALLIVEDRAAAAMNGNGDLLQRVRRSLPPHWTCVAVKVVPRLPRTVNGKIARAHLPMLL